MSKSTQMFLQENERRGQKTYEKPVLTVRRFLFKNDIADTSYWATIAGENEVNPGSFGTRPWYDMQ